MRKFCVRTLGCKVNHYESEQIATLLRLRGWEQTEDAREADLRVVNTCSVTTQAASKSRQTTRQMARPADPSAVSIASNRSTRSVSLAVISQQPTAGPECERSTETSLHALDELDTLPTRGHASTSLQRVIVTGCWATSDREAAMNIPGVSAVLTHHDDLASELDRLLSGWQHDEWRDDPRDERCEVRSPGGAIEPFEADQTTLDQPRPGASGDDGAETVHETPAARFVAGSKPRAQTSVKKKNSKKARLLSFAQTDVDMKRGAEAGEMSYETGANEGNPAGEKARGSVRKTAERGGVARGARGATTLPLLEAHQDAHQRAFLKVQDGCDAHCTYCIIPKLRPRLWSKTIDDAVAEARAMVASGHVELVLTGIFLGAYGQETALRRRQASAGRAPIGELVEALCTDVEGLRRVRLSSLEPGDLTEELVAVLKRYPQVVPHFHLPLQSGSETLLRKMNRQYSREDFLEMAGRVKEAFDRPALTTDIIVGFPGETDEEFARTAEVVERVGFLHVHAFPFSPRPGTAAARWGKEFVRGPVVNERIELLTRMAGEFSYVYRKGFVGEVVELLVERGGEDGMRHGRCERYFDVWFQGEGVRTGDCVKVRVDRVTGSRTLGTLVEVVR